MYRKNKKTFCDSKTRNRGIPKGKVEKSLFMVYVLSLSPWPWEGSGKPTERFPAALCILSRRGESMKFPRPQANHILPGDCHTSDK